MTDDDLQVCALTFAPQHTRAIVLTVFVRRCYRICWRMGCMGRVARRRQQIACISVQESRRASTLQRRRERCGGGDRMAYVCCPS